MKKKKFTPEIFTCAAEGCLFSHWFFNHDHSRRSAAMKPQTVFTWKSPRGIIKVGFFNTESDAVRWVATGEL